MSMQVNINGIWKSVSNDSSGGGNVIIGTAKSGIHSGTNTPTTTKISFTPTQTGLVMVCGTSTSATGADNILYVGPCTSGTEINLSKPGGYTYTIKYIIFY